MRFYSFTKRLCAFILGAVFLIGGLFKLMDPVGSALVMESYFSFLHLGFLRALSTEIALVFNLLECFVGVSLVSGIWVKVMRNITLALLSIFTILTLLLLIFNPDMDCGCFGEVVHLTHLQSFLKNVFLFVLWGIAFLPYVRQHRRPLYRKIVSGIVGVMVLVFAAYSFMRLPLLDLTELHTGKELVEGDISLMDDAGDYADALLLNGKVVLVSVYNPSRANCQVIDRIRRQARHAGLRTVVAVSGDLSMEEGCSISTYFADRKALVSVNRANMGVTFISAGQIAQKWTPGEFLSLSDSELKKVVETDPSELILDETLSGRRRFGIIALAFFVFLLI